jgi:epoxyqueuosine reductase
MKKADWEQLTPEAFQQIFNKSAVKRAGYKGLTQNINWVKQK